MPAPKRRIPDEIDLEILSILSENAKMPEKTIGHQVGLSRNSVHKRIRSLEETGFISGYTIKKGITNEVDPVSAFLFIKLGERKCVYILPFLKTLDGITASYSVGGETVDMVLLVEVPNNQALNILRDKIEANENVVKVETHFILEERFDIRKING